jgi:hypothetical protein
MSLSPPSTFLRVAGSCTVVDKNAHTIGAIQQPSTAWENQVVKIVGSEYPYLLTKKNYLIFVLLLQ